MINGLKCQHGIVSIDFCKEECKNRCAPKSYIDLIINNSRTWTGIPSATQLLNGTCEEYLKVTNDYAVEPDKLAFAVSGTKKHANFEQYAGDNSETRIFALGISGQPDEIEGDTVIDYKTSGSYKVAQCLGIQKTKIPDGFYKNGKPKFASIIDKVEPDLGEYKMQLNIYRVILNQITPERIQNMKIFFIVRDGGTIAAISRGIDKNIYYVNVPKIPNQEVIKFIDTKRDALIEAVNTKTLPDKCSPSECWDGRKCEKYCEVRDICPYNN